MKHMSHRVQASTILGNSSDVTPSTSSVGLLSIRSNRRGKDSHRLKQRRQPWQMSKMRRISASSLASSQNAASFHAIGSRVGASRLPSRDMRKDRPVILPRLRGRSIHRSEAKMNREGGIPPFPTPPPPSASRPPSPPRGRGDKRGAL